MTWYQRFRHRLQMLLFGLTVKPIAGGEETEKEKEEREAREAAEAAENEETKPPWGDEEKNFDADRAWKLIQDLRSDNTKIKTERDDLRTKVQEHEDASKSDQEKLSEGKTQAEKTAAEATQEAARLRVALKKGLTETQAKRLVGENEQQLETDADELLESFRSDGEEQESSQRRPRERLRPGAAPSAKPEKNDPASLAEEVPRGW